tara:strand:- start:2607 stop:2774 length:168 start_codon:yes stop_codon:yes gene_type:complete
MTELVDNLLSKEAWLRTTPGQKHANVKLTHAELVDILAALEITKNVVSMPKATEK